jgi:hypothetical protein
MRGHIWGNVDAKLVAPESNLAELWNEVVCVSQSVHRMASDNPQSIRKGNLIYRVSLLHSFPMHPTADPGFNPRGKPHILPPHYETSHPHFVLGPEYHGSFELAISAKLVSGISDNVPALFTVYTVFMRLFLDRG